MSNKQNPKIEKLPILNKVSRTNNNFVLSDNLSELRHLRKNLLILLIKKSTFLNLLIVQN